MWSSYWPVYRTPLLNLYDRTSPIPFRDPKSMQDYRSLRLPNTERVFEETAVLLSHPHMLGSAAYVKELLAAVRKVSDDLPGARAAWEKAEKEKKPA